MKKSTIVILVVLVVVVLYGFVGYNRLVTLNEQADGQWSQVENQYQRRFDLIPNLVNSVQGALTQEQKVFGDIADARTAYGNAGTPDEKAKAASQVESSLGRLLVIVENYPALMSIQAVRDLMTQLEGTENRVSVERMRFNEIVRDYNVNTKRVPMSILASIFGFDERAYFEAVSGAETAPTVDLE